MISDWPFDLKNKISTDIVVSDVAFNIPLVKKSLALQIQLHTYTITINQGEATLTLVHTFNFAPDVSLKYISAWHSTRN